MLSRIKQTNSSNHKNSLPLWGARLVSVVLLLIALGAGVCIERIGQVASPAREGKNPQLNNLPSAKAVAVCPLGSNLIINGDAEADTAATGDGYENLDVSAWENETGEFTVARYDAPSGFPASTDPGPANRGQFLFVAGYADTSSGSQIIDLSGCTSQIDSGTQQFNLSGFLGGFGPQNDSPRAVLTFKDATNAPIGTASIGYVTAAERNSITGLIEKKSIGMVPVGTRSVEVLLQMTRFQGVYNDGYADSLSLILDAPTNCSPLPSGAVGWWKAEGNADDVLGVNNGVLQNGATFSSGLIGQAFSFDGVDDYVSINRSIQDDFTIEFWLNTTQIVGTDSGQWYEGRGLVDGEVQTVTNDFGVTLKNGKVLFGVGNPDVTIRSGFVADGNWHHVAATRLRSTGQMKLYIDGIQVASANAGTQSLTTPPRITLGQVQVDGNRFQGKLDEVSIYDRPLSPTEIQSIFNAGNLGKCASTASCATTPPNLVAWWQAEGNASDSIGSHNGTLQNVTFAAGKVGQGFKLNQSDGTPDYVSFPDSLDLRPTNFTIEAWVRFDALDSPNTSAPGLQYIIFKKNTRTGNFEGYDLHKVRVNGVDKISTTISSATGTFATVNSQTNVSAGQFYHVAATHNFNGTAGTLKLYVNGVLEGSAAANFPPDYDNRPVFLGSSGETFFNGYLDGVIDEASIYNRALSQAEIQSIYNAGNTGKCAAGAIQSLTFSPNPVNGGQSSTGTVTLAAAAPAGGAVVNLSSNNPSAANVPSSITMTEGQTTGTFSVTTFVPPSDASALITAFYQAGETSATLTVLAPKPDLMVSAASVPASTQTDSAFNISWTVQNQGPARADAPWTDRVWLSNDNQLGNDTLIGEFPFSSNLESNQTVDRIQTLSIARNAISQDGPYFLLIQTDASSQINEGGNEDNNFVARPINITRQPRPDLVVDSIVAPNSAFFGQTILVQWTVKNIGGGPTNAQAWLDFVYLSIDNVPEIEDPFKIPVTNVSYLSAGESYTATAEVKIPQGLVGQYKVIVWTDGDGTNHRSNDSPHQVTEDNDENNYGIARPIQINAPTLPDLQTVSVVAPEEVFAGAPMTLNWRVENLGDGVTPPDQINWVDKVYLSQDTTLDVNTDRLVGSRPRSGALTQNEGYTVSNFSITLPHDIAGDWFVFILADGDKQVYEFNNETNNANYERQQPGSPMRIRATPPDLVIPASLNAPANGSAGQSLSIGWTVKNQGAFEAAPNWFDAVYLSPDQTLDTENDTLLTSVFRSSSLGPGLAYDVTANVTVPSCISGTYYLFVLSDSRRQIFEFDPSLNAEANNSSQPRPIQIVDATPDLRVTAVSHPATGNAGQQINVSWTVANQGTGATTQTKWTDRVYLSSTQTFDSATALLIGLFDHTGALNNGENYTRTENLAIPNAAQGSYFVTVLTDTGNEVEECANNTNNIGVGAQSLVINNSLPDLVVQSASSQANPVGGQTISVEWAIANQGVVAINNPSWGDAVYFSSDGVLGSDDVRLVTAAASGPLAIGATYNRQVQVTLPVVAPGNYFLIIQADYLGNVFEGQREDNNLRNIVLPIQVPAVDLTVTTSDAPATAFSGQDMTVSWTVLNNGTNPTVGSHWVDEVVLSLDQIDDPSDRVIGSKRHDGVLNGQASYNDSLSVFVPQGFTGQYYVFVRTDRRNEVAESNENNSSAADGIVFNLTPPADLVVSSIAPPSSGSPGEALNVNWTIQNNGTNPATGLWNDAVYLSADQTWDIGDILIGRQTQIGPIAAGQSYNGQLTTTLPAINPGNYYVIVRSDAQNRVREVDEANNNGVTGVQTSIDVPELQIGIPRNTTLVTGQERFYKTNAPANETLLFTVDGQTGSSNELFTRFGQIASRNLFDFAFTHPNEPDQEVVIQNSQAGTHYNLVRAEFVPAAAPVENVTIKADIVPFNIRQVSPTQAGNLGFSTLTIDGGKFHPNATVKLINDAGMEILPLQTKIDQSQIAALFDLRQKPTGTYDVVVANPGGEIRTLSDGFSIVAGGGHQISVSVSSLGSIRPNTYGRFTVSVRNKGLNDALLTPVLIFLPANSEFRLSRKGEIDPLTQADLPPGLNLEDVPISIDTEDGKMIPLLIPILRRGDTLDISIDVLASSTDSSMLVRASLLPPMLTTDLTTSQGLLSKNGAKSSNLTSNDHGVFCIAEALTRFTVTFLSSFLPTACARAISEQILDALTIPSELFIRNKTGERAGFSGWETIGGVIISFLYRTGVCIVDFSPLKSIKVAVKVMEAIKHLWDDYKRGKLLGECITPPPPPDDYDHITTSSIHRPIDPNDKVGPLGFGAQQFVNTQQDLPYRINFENLSTASAYAQRIRITDQLDPNLDPRTLRLREIGFKQYRFQVPNNRAFFQQRVQLGPDLGNVLADISAGVDLSTGTVTWTLTAIDPATGEQPNGASLGLLPPNNDSNDGQGFVTFTVKPKSTVAAGVVIHNEATITFDTEAPIITNTVMNTLDAGMPSSAVNPLPATSQETFTLSWAGNDVVGGSGLQSYDIWMAEDDGPYQPFLSGTTETSKPFTGQPGRTYRFYSIARDNAGNVESPPAVADATTTIAQAQSPVPVVTKLNPDSTVAGSPEFTLNVSGNNFVNTATVQWNGTPRATTFVSATELRAVITADDVDVEGTASVIVVNPGSLMSNALAFTISAGSPTPTPTPTPTPQPYWESLEGGGFDMVVGRNLDGRLEIFVRGFDNALYHKSQLAPNSSAWGSWDTLGGGMDKIAVANNADGRLEVFVRGNDGALWHRSQVAPNSSNWNGWSSLGGGFDQLCVGANADGRLQVFVRGLDKVPYYRTQSAPNSASWNNWASLEGGVNAVNVASNSDGRLELFVRGLDNALYHKWQLAPNSNSWSGWAGLGGGTDLFAVGRNADGRLEVFARGTDQALYHRHQVSAGSSSWSAWGSLGMGIDDLAVARNVAGGLEVFVRGKDGVPYHIWQTAPNADTWSAWFGLGGSIDQLVVGQNAAGHPEVFVRGVDKLIYHMPVFSQPP
jgi:subtilase family serine protease